MVEFEAKYQSIMYVCWFNAAIRRATRRWSYRVAFCICQIIGFNLFLQETHSPIKKRQTSFDLLKTCNYVMYE